MRHGLCLKCGGQIPSTKYRNAKYCSAKCRAAYNALKHAYKTGRIKNPGVGSGGAQWGKDNHQYKTGIGTFRKKAIEAHGEFCNRCGSTQEIEVHHIDENRNNNKLSNLEVLCKQCHRNHHIVRDDLGRFTKPDIKV